jgi:DnaK suppressor protein
MPLKVQNMLHPELSKERLSLLKHRIDERIEALRGEVSQVLRQSDHPQSLQFANHFAETDDEAVAGLALATEIAEVERDLHELSALGFAKRRLARGDYGTCVDCGEPIPYKRLNAQLTATRCIGCQENAERAEGSHGPPRL